MSGLKYKTSYESEVPLKTSDKVYGSKNSNRGYESGKKKENSYMGGKKGSNYESIHYGSSYEQGSSAVGQSAKDKNYRQKQATKSRSPSQHILLNNKQMKHGQQKILSQHNSSHYSLAQPLFPQQDSIKQKLKQNLQQQMLSNYYVNKYESLMSKMSKDKMRIQELDECDSELADEREGGRKGGEDERKQENQRRQEKESGVGMSEVVSGKKRRNFREVMKQKEHKYQNQQSSLNAHNHTQQQSNINNPNTSSQNNEFLSVTFSPSKRFNLHIGHESQPSPSYGLENYRTQRENSVRSSRQNKNNSNSRLKSAQKSLAIQERSRLKSIDKSISKSIGKSVDKSKSKIGSKTQSEQRNNYPLLKKPKPISTHAPQYNQAPKPSSSQHLTSAHLQSTPLKRASPHQQKTYQSSLSPPRHNFKQSLKQKKSLYVQYEHNLNLYKQLQSSIINQLYSPSPKKIQNPKYNQIHLYSRELSHSEMEELEKDFMYVANSDKSQKSSHKRNLHHMLDNHLNIQINDDEHQLQIIQRQYTQREYVRQSQSEQKHQLHLLKQNIQNSLHPQKSTKSSPRHRQPSPDHNLHMKHSPSPITPLQSPKRSLISDQQSKHSQEDSWNPYFAKHNHHNKKLLLNHNSPAKRRIDLIGPMQKYGTSLNKHSTQKPSRNYHSLDRPSPQIQKTIQTIKHIAQKSHYKNPSLHIQINQQDQHESDFQPSAHPNKPKPQPFTQRFNTKSQANDHFHTKPSGNIPRTHQRKGSFHSIKSSPKPQPESRYIHEHNSNSQNSSNKQFKTPSEHQSDNDIEFIPPADEALFRSGDSNEKSSHEPRKNHIDTIGHTRSRKPSEQLSFISDANSFHEMSMLSRFSMTSEEGSMIIRKLDNQITENEFGPYQNALEGLGELLSENKTAWPIYVVGQKVLDDRAEYEKKIRLQKNMLEGYKEKIIGLKEVELRIENGRDGIIKNQLAILRLVRQLASQA